MSEQLALLPYLLGAHVRLTLAALLLGAAVAVPVGVLVSRAPRLEGLVLGLAGVIQTVPALALLAVMVPLLSSAGLSGIGFLPAFLGLVLYSLLPILRNTVTGLAGIDPAVREAAEGVGMTPGQRLRMVELPLALPVILAGLRTATVWSVGMATLSTPVGAPSLGNYIFSGLQTRNYDAVLVGCAAAALLALGLDGLLRILARGYSRAPARPRAGRRRDLRGVGRRERGGARARRRRASVDGSEPRPSRSSTSSPKCWPVRFTGRRVRRWRCSPPSARRSLSTPWPAARSTPTSSTPARSGPR